jgi:uncharacterized membrane protein YgcG
MSLANQGVIRMEPTTVEKSRFLGMGTKEEQTYELTLDREKRKGLDPLDEKLTEILFFRVADREDRLTIDELKAYAKKSPQSFSNAMKGWKTDAKKVATEKGFFEGGQLRQGLTFILAVVVFVATLWASIYASSFIPALIGTPAAIIIGITAVFMDRRTREGNELYAKYDALKNYLEDFSRLDEAPPTHVKLWEHYLVLAVVFGVAEQVIEQMRVAIPEVVNDPGFAHSYWWVYGAGGYGNSPVSSLQTGFVSAASIASSEMSSSSGGGGGFSGGGGAG